MNLFSDTISLLERSLDYSSLKQKVISNNIANADTPKYKAKDVSFKKMFAESIANQKQMSAFRSNNRHFDFQMNTNHPAVVTTRHVNVNNNGNSVDVDKEMSDLATNQIYYNAVTEGINGKFQTLQTVIKGGK
ncbi:flagellar basal-body rod protein FlgB [Oikeobacillus pervagus]|uniref:Flagellar basal body rod protein FlgB n=1 Tax=Oikeobacillus pervagus TaxID=1325931 RepID=A0AAJ1WFT3_9BACI|nr:flagellar basal body rod protein FlgB [Oikeobacillus pervagus]MDQ0214307.1 flagellar basal-body rod protein FlgB [Oikeobacillus pervagus]